MNIVKSCFRASLVVVALLTSVLSQGALANDKFHLYADTEDGYIILRSIPGEEVSGIFMIFNDGATDLNLTVSSTGPGFSVAPTSILVEAGDMGFVEVFFNPTKTGTEFGTVSVTDGIDTESLDLEGIAYADFDESELPLQFGDYFEFGPVAQFSSYCESLLIHNPTDEPFVIDDAQLAGIGGGAFRLDSNGTFPQTIAPGADLYFDVCYETVDSLSLYAYDELTLSYHPETRPDLPYTTYASLFGFSWDVDESDPTDCLIPEFVQNSAVLYGGKSIDTLYFNNTTDRAITVTSMVIDGDDSASFKILGNAPIAVPANSERTVLVQFTPVEDDDFRSIYYTTLKFEATGNGNDCSNEVILFGSALEPSEDSLDVQCFPREEVVLGIRDSVPTAVRTFSFYNNLKKAWTAVDVRLRDGKKFRIQSTNPALPARVEPLGKFDVVVVFESKDSGFFEDEILLTLEETFKMQPFKLQGVQIANLASVSDGKNSENELMLFPNPASTNVSVHHSLAKAKVEIVDILGNVVASHAGGENWNWTPANEVLNGTYIVRSTGINSKGKQVTNSRILRLERYAMVR